MASRCANSLIEIWQANAAGRYAHARDNHPAPLDPNFTGTGRSLDRRGRILQFCDHQAGRLSVAQSRKCVASGAYSFFIIWAGVCHATDHTDVFSWRSAVCVRSYSAVDSDEKARQRLVSKFDLETTKPEWALGYRFDIVLRGREATPFES